MAKKGKEPAGLRKYRLAQKAKKAKRSPRPKTARKVKTMARRRSYGRKRRASGRRFKPSIATLGGIGISVYSAYQDAQAAGSEKLNTFISSFTGIGIGRYSDNGTPTFNMGNAIKSATPIGAGMLISYGGNQSKNVKYGFKKIPFVGRKFKL